MRLITGKQLGIYMGINKNFLSFIINYCLILQHFLLSLTSFTQNKAIKEDSVNTKARQTEATIGNRQNNTNKQ